MFLYKSLVKALWNLCPSLLFHDFDQSEENPGTAPFSEPKIQIMRKLAM